MTAENAGSNGRVRILIVEDEAIVATDIQNTLESLGFTVLDRAATGEEAVRKTLLLKPDLVLMDVKLKGNMDGIKAGLEIRAVHKTPIIFLTAYSHPFHRDDPRCYLMPRHPILSKPFDTTELERAIDVCLNGRTPSGCGA